MQRMAMWPMCSAYLINALKKFVAVCSKCGGKNTNGHVCKMWTFFECKLFNAMPKTNLVSWNKMIEGYIQMGL